MVDNRSKSLPASGKSPEEQKDLSVYSSTTHWQSQQIAMAKECALPEFKEFVKPSFSSSEIQSFFFLNAKFSLQTSNELA